MMMLQQHLDVHSPVSLFLSQQLFFPILLLLHILHKETYSTINHFLISQMKVDLFLHHHTFQQSFVKFQELLLESFDILILSDFLQVEHKVFELLLFFQLISFL